MHRQYPPYSTRVILNTTTSRELDTRYTNTTGRSLFVYCSVACATPAVNDAARAELRTGTGTFRIGRVGLSAGISPSTLFQVSGVILPGDTFEVVTFKVGTGIVDEVMWFESY